MARNRTTFRNKDKPKRKDKPVRNAKGQIVKGSPSINPRGRPLGGTSFMDDFRAALKEVEKTKRKSLLRHFIERAYSDNRVLVAAVDRILPTLKAIELQGVISSMDDETAASIQKKLTRRWNESNAE